MDDLFGSRVQHKLPNSLSKPPNKPLDRFTQYSCGHQQTSSNLNKCTGISPDPMTLLGLRFSVRVSKRDVFLYQAANFEIAPLREAWQRAISKQHAAQASTFRMHTCEQNSVGLVFDANE